MLTRHIEFEELHDTNLQDLQDAKKARLLNIPNEGDSYWLHVWVIDISWMKIMLPSQIKDYLRAWLTHTGLAVWYG